MNLPAGSAHSQVGCLSRQAPNVRVTAVFVYIRFILFASFLTFTNYAHARNPDLRIEWQLRWSDAESLPGMPTHSFIGYNSIVGGAIKMNGVKKEGNYNLYTWGESLDGKNYSLLLQFLNESHTYISPSQLFSIALPYENCSDWSDWDKPKYVKLIEYGIGWAILNKRELEFVDQGNSPLFEIRYRVTSWSKLCDYKTLTHHSSGTPNGAP